MTRKFPTPLGKSTLQNWGNSTCKKQVTSKVPYKYYHPRENKEFSTRSFDYEQYITEECPKVGFDKMFRCLSHRAIGIQVGERSPITCNIMISALSTDRLNHVNSEFRLNAQGVVEGALSTGAFLSIGGMPTGIRIDDWVSKGAVNKRYLAIADVPLVVSDELDAGRKGISRLRASQVSDAALELKNRRIALSGGKESDMFSSYATKYMDWGNATTTEEDHDFEARVADAYNSSTEDQRNNPALMRALTTASSLIRFPSSEEEVRVLFHEMLAKGLLKGYRTVYAAGSRALYDSSLSYSIQLNDENLYPQDPIGFSASYAGDYKKTKLTAFDLKQFHRRMGLVYPELCVEFKPSIYKLLEDVTKPGMSSKSVRDINLLIVWDSEIPASYHDKYTLQPLQGDMRYLHGVTHRLGVLVPEPADIFCIVLKRALELLYTLDEADSISLSN